MIEVGGQKVRGHQGIDRTPWATPPGTHESNIPYSDVI